MHNVFVLESKGTEKGARYILNYEVKICDKLLYHNYNKEKQEIWALDFISNYPFRQSVKAAS